MTFGRLLVTEVTELVTENISMLFLLRAMRVIFHDTFLSTYYSFYESHIFIRTEHLLQQFQSRTCIVIFYLKQRVINLRCQYDDHDVKV